MQMLVEAHVKLSRSLPLHQLTWQSIPESDVAMVTTDIISHYILYTYAHNVLHTTAHTDFELRLHTYGICIATSCTHAHT